VRVSITYRKNFNLCLSCHDAVRGLEHCLTRNSPVMNASRYRRFPYLLALIGQSVVMFGLPIPAFNAEHRSHGTPDSVCGCSPSDRAEKRCCCSKPGDADRCCSIVPAIYPDDDECYAASNALGESPKSCCARKDTGRPDRSETDSRTPLRWVGGVLSQRCLGVFDKSLAPLTLQGSLPESSFCLVFDRSLCCWLLVAAATPIIVPTIPSVPPPR